MRHALPVLLAAICLPATTGCANLLKRPAVVRATPQNPAAEIVGLWQPAKGPGQNGLPTRGLAGRLMFFTRGNAAPAIVDGEVRVYLFDNQGPPDAQARPIHQFDFRAEDWPNFLQSSTLGPTYNLFIPYVRGGHKQVECTIQVRFSPKNGPAVFSELTTVTLPGTVESEEGPATPGLAARADTSGSPADVLAAASRSRLAVHTIPQHRASAAGRPALPTSNPLAEGVGQRTAVPSPTAGEIGGSTAETQSAIQQTSWSVEPPSAPAAAGRIAELEELVRQLQAERTAGSGATQPHSLGNGVRTSAPAAHPLRPDDSDEAAAIESDATHAEPKKRFRLSPTTRIAEAAARRGNLVPHPLVVTETESAGAGDAAPAVHLRLKAGRPDGEASPGSEIEVAASEPAADAPLAAAPDSRFLQMRPAEFPSAREPGMDTASNGWMLSEEAGWQAMPGAR